MRFARLMSHFRYRAAGIMSGQVVFNGQARGQSFWDNSAYVRQDDIHIPTLTVFETLTFAARLRLGSVSSTFV